VTGQIPDAVLPGADARALRRHHFAVLRSVPLRWNDDDTYGHVNNAVHYLLFDTAVNGWLLDATGCDIRRLPAIGVVAETACRYLGELRFPQPVTAGIALDRLGRTSVVYRLALFRGDADQPAAVGRFVHVYVDGATRRPVPVPAEIRRALRALDPNVEEAP
jgi:acyl-CoA thioester hydrolase